MLYVVDLFYAPWTILSITEKGVSKQTATYYHFTVNIRINCTVSCYCSASDLSCKFVLLLDIRLNKLTLL